MGVMDVPNVHELKVVDLGGVAIEPSEIVSDELVGWLSNLDTTLGTPEDPHYNEYKSFLAEINDAKIITLSGEDLKGDNNNKYDELDLNSDQKIEDLSKAFLMFMAQHLFKGKGVGPYDIANTIKGSTQKLTFAPFEKDAWYDPTDSYSISCEK